MARGVKKFLSYRRDHLVSNRGGNYFNKSFPVSEREPASGFREVLRGAVLRARPGAFDESALRKREKFSATLIGKVNKAIPVRIRDVFERAELDDDISRGKNFARSGVEVWCSTCRTGVTLAYFIPCVGDNRAGH